MRRTHLLVLGLALFVAGCAGPCGLMSGGTLDGEERPPPSDWTFAGDDGLAQLETKPADPYSVNLVYTVVNGVLYVNAGDTETEWVKNMTLDPHVRLRIGEAIYPLRAERVTDAAEIAEFGVAWTGQSMFRRDPTEFDEVFVFRLVER